MCRVFYYLKYNPCFGYFLQGAVRTIALVDLMMAIFIAALVGSIIAEHFGEWRESQQESLFLFFARAIIWATLFAITFSVMGLSIFLFKAARLRDHRRCKIWMIISETLNLLFLGVIFVDYLLFDLPLVVYLCIPIFIIFKSYRIHVVLSFIKEIRSYGGFNAALSGLTDDEVEEFERGNPPETAIQNELELVQKQAFNKDFQIDVEDLELDDANILGSGAFGTVFKGKLLNTNPPRVVAIKTVCPTADKSYFKTLLGELKIMTFLPPHKNVVNLLGACTSQIKDKKLYIVVELCQYGNLHEYLKSRRALFTSFVKDGEIVDLDKNQYTNIHPTNSITTEDLIKWSLDTARGMEFLANNKVIHGDLAARNILLGAGKVAKITDFGLSKKLYQYNLCVNKQQKLLPWRWMALESLKDLQFSVKSDVWSFGVTMWEIFSLSELPYPGFTWDMNFMQEIEQGLRMNQPVNAPNKLFQFMLKCWEPNPDTRPDFTEAASFLAHMQSVCASILCADSNQNDSSHHKPNYQNLNSDTPLDYVIPE